MPPSLRETSRYTKLFRKFSSSAAWMSCSPQIFSKVRVSTSDHRKPRVVFVCIAGTDESGYRRGEPPASGRRPMMLTMRIMMEVGSGCLLRAALRLRGRYSNTPTTTNNRSCR